MDTLKWLLFSPMPTVGAFFFSCIMTFCLRSHTSGNEVSHDVLAGFIPDLSFLVPWFWATTVIFLVLYGFVGKYLSTRW